MDPNNQGPAEHGHDDGQAQSKRPPRDALTQDFDRRAPAPARTVQFVSGDLLLTVNPVDGSEVENCPPGELPGQPVRHPPAERAAIDGAARPPVPPGPSLPRLPLLQRDDERGRLVRLLARGRSVRLTGAPGSGRTALLDAVAEHCVDLAPDGIVRLSGFRRTADDLLYELFAAVYSTHLFRPARQQILDIVRDIGAVVVLDDLEFGGSALDELLDATPECAFLIGATPDIPLPSADAPLEEMVLGGFDRAGSEQLLERAVGRVLTEDESNWAGDLWFESEGLPLRFTQAGALLRQRDRQRAGAEAVDEFGVFQEGPSADAPFEAAADEHDIPLPSLAEGVAPAALLASRLSASARETLRFAVALDGEVPHQAHLPALVGDTHADAALGELVGCALVTPVGARYRLAAGVRTQLEAAGYADDAETRAGAAARHYAWWAGHPSVTPERVSAEADAVLAALTALVPGTTPPGEGEESAAVVLARQAAPAFAAGQRWSAWERALRAGAEAAGLAAETGEQAYFHHEMGVLALCCGQLERARAELESSIGLRNVLADKRGTVAGRRALALVADRSGATPPGGRTAAGEEVPDARREESASPPGGVPSAYSPTGFGAAGFGAVGFGATGSGATGVGAAGFGATEAGTPPANGETTLVSRRPGVASPAHRLSGLKGVIGSARRNLMAVGAGALLAAVLGTVVTLGAASDRNGDTPAEEVGVNPSASEGVDGGGLSADRPKTREDGDAPGAVPEPTTPGPDGTSDDPTPTDTARPTDDPSTERPTGRPTTSPTKNSPKPTPSDDPSTDPTDEPTDDPTGDPSTDPTGEPTDDPTGEPTDDPTDNPPPPDTTNTAGAPTSSRPAESGSAVTTPDSPSGTVA